MKLFFSKTSSVSYYISSFPNSKITLQKFLSAGALSRTAEKFYIDAKKNLLHFNFFLFQLRIEWGGEVSKGY